MKDKLLKIKDKPFIRNVLILTTGTATAQAVGLVSSPIITRLYGPEAFGIMGVFMAIAQIFVPVAALTYPIAIVLPRDDQNAKKLMKLSLLVSLGIFILITLVLLLFNNGLIELFQIQNVSAYLFLIPLVILFSGVMQVFEQWLIRTKQFTVNAKVSFLQSFITNGGKVGFGLFNPVASVLVFLSASANGLKALMMMLYLKKSKYVSNEIQNEQLSLMDLAKKYKDFPMYRAPEVLINAISQRFPILMLTTFFGPVAAGFYTLSNTVLQKPIQLIGNSVGNVFYQRISDAANNKESLTNLIKKATISIATVGIVPFGMIIFFGPWIFSFIFGGEWSTAGEYAQWIGLFLFCEFINKPSVKALPVLSAQRFHLNFTIIILLIRVSAL